MTSAIIKMIITLLYCGEIHLRVASHRKETNPKLTALYSYLKLDNIHQLLGTIL